MATLKTSKPKESVGQTVARAKAMLAQTKSEGSKSFKGSSYEKDYHAGKYNVITSDKIKPTTDLMSTLPKSQPVDGLYGVQDSNTAALAAATGATFDTKTKQMTPAVQNQAQDTFQQYLSYLDSAQSENPSNESMVKAQRKEVRPYEQNVQRYQNELNTITADRERAILSLEGQGRGQTEGFVGGEQARISREAAIRALPVQAQLAAAQQDLDSARSYTAQLFQARAQDAQARYNYKKEIGQTIFSYLNQQEQRAYAERQREEDRAFSVEQSNRNNLKQLSLQALEWGQGALAGEIMRLDPASPTFDQDYGDVTSRLRKPVAAKAPTLQNFGSTDKPNWQQYNYSTGQWEKPAYDVTQVSGGVEGAHEYELQKADIQMGYKTAQDLLNNKLGLNLATGAYQSPLLTTLVKNVGGTTAGFAAAGSVVPGIGTAAGTITGLGVGLVTAPFAYSANKTAQDNFLAGTSFLINDSTFQEIRNLRAQGVTFGNMTEGERIAAGRAATNLTSAAELDESGKVTGFRGDPKTVEGYIRDIMVAYEGRQEYLDRAYSIQPLEESEAVTVWSSQN